VACACAMAMTIASVVQRRVWSWCAVLGLRLQRRRCADVGTWISDVMCGFTAPKSGGSDRRRGPMER
jgi:hypothetical protein